MAGGFSIKVENIEKFKDFIFKKLNNINVNVFKEKSLYFDSVIAPTAINFDFYSKINLLAPFGSGNPEPKFIIENMRSVNSKIIKEKHIKSIIMEKKNTKNIKTNQ